MSRWTASLLIVLLFAATLFFIEHTGRSSRRFVSGGPSFYLANTSAEVYSIWKEKGARGRVLVHMGRYLHFVPPDEERIYQGRERFPIETVSLTEEYEKSLNEKNFLLVAMQTGIARELYNVIPPGVFRQMLETADRTLVSEDTILLHVMGSRRTLTDRIPAIKEHVLLNIDASYFTMERAERLSERLRESGIRADVLTLCLSRDIPSVTDEERAQLMLLAEALWKGEGAPR